MEGHFYAPTGHWAILAATRRSAKVVVSGVFEASMDALSDELAAKRDRLIDLLASYGSCGVAFSGGLDSSVLAKAARVALGDRAVAVTCVSESLTEDELDQCRRMARRIGIRHEIIPTNELCNPDYRQNAADRCYHCKKDRYVHVAKAKRQLAVAVLADGTNQDDFGEHRPGLRAVREQAVRTPLVECGLTKSELRALAADWDVPLWDKPPTTCLATRIAYGEEITPQRLAMIGRAEQFLRKHGFEPLRVRYHRGDSARIEVAPEAIGKFLDPAFRREVVEQLKSAGFKYVALDLEGFRSGSMNEALPHESLHIQSDASSG